ncbi:MULTISPECIES: flippase [Paraburkholderia]|jgi:O-antigen/teichoic acid export membrane protein|uniref:Membrane protein involved in the export of O-antigen and teichoic acid n=1 Tax=Paraburkholderia phenazinium TaxID=60549 RepID=A0A1N6H3T0_9BURK|nr:flippase [Paraburkholderia phenazinium]SIO14365.1 Membrane protein involved in the export of O-antigen and teichoic acid [Paraburkholderia phenazinium]
MTARPSLKRSATLNFIGGILPMFVALVTTPIYLHYIGAARYGVLAIVWMVQGYFGFLDLGLSSATSNRIAQLGEEPHREREAVLWTALILNAALGLAGGVALYGLMHVLLSYFDMGPDLRNELLPALPCVACLVPLSNLISVFNGALVGRERFGTLNVVTLPVTLMYQLVPLGAALLFGPNLRYLVYGTLVAGIAALLVTAFAVWRVFPLRLAAGPRRDLVGKLFSYGAWISVTSLAQPLLETADRLMIGHALGPQAVTYYQVPFNLAGRVRIFPSVIVRTLFPRLSALDAASAAALSSSSIRGLAAALTPMTVFGIFLMHPFLSLWVGQDFAARAASVGETILVGIWLTSIASLAACHLQAIGKPGIVARFQAYEMLPFFALLWWMLQHFGVLGAALAWSARCLLDGVLLLHAARLDARPTRMLAVPALIIALAYVGTLVFAPLTWPAIVVWLGTTAVALAWSARTEPRAYARLLELVASMRNYTRRWAQSSQ